MKTKYAWDTLQKPGDSFLVDEIYTRVARCACSIAKLRGWELSVKKVLGGTVVRRVA